AAVLHQHAPAPYRPLARDGRVCDLRAPGIRLPLRRAPPGGICRVRAKTTGAYMNETLVQKQFGVAAADYATSAVHASGPSLARLVALVPTQREWSALDVATEAGHTALAFAPLVARVVASDITDAMLHETEKLAAARGLTNVATAKGEAGKLPFADSSFDLVTCSIAAHHFPDASAFVADSFRVLKPGG